MFRGKIGDAMPFLQGAHACRPQTRCEAAFRWPEMCHAYSVVSLTLRSPPLNSTYMAGNASIFY